MATEFNQLILSIREAIKSYGDGSLPFAKAQEEYQRLQGEYARLAKGSMPDHRMRSLADICYMHNINNFSLLTGVYRISEHAVSVIDFHGDRTLQKKLLQTLQERIDRISHEEISLIPVGPDGAVTPFICVMPMDGDGHGGLYAVCQSSSSYFSRKTFEQYVNFIQGLMDILRARQQPVVVDFFDETVQKIRDFLTIERGPESVISARIYYFNMLENIFLHLGLRSIMEISESIIKIIKTSYPADSLVIDMAINEYLVLFKGTGEPSPGGKPGKLEFRHMDISLPYQTLPIHIKSQDSLYTLLKEIYTINNYFTNGDIMR